jgi:hypothetical protein
MLERRRDLDDGPFSWHRVDVNQNFASVGVGTHRNMRVGDLLKRVPTINNRFQLT